MMKKLLSVLCVALALLMTMPIVGQAIRPAPATASLRGNWKAKEER